MDMNRDFNYVKHSANIGDIVASMCALKKLYEITGKKKIVFMQKLDMKGAYPTGSHHPVRDKNDVAVCCNAKMLEMITPLMKSQEYIQDVIEFSGQEATVDIDEIRMKTFVNLGFMAIQQWPMLAFPDLATDISKKWIEVGGGVRDPESSYYNKIILNFTDRYRNHIINYFFLSTYEKYLVFAGAPDEHEVFCKEWKLDIPYLQINNFLELAYVLKDCMFMIGNQSFNWNLAEAMKTPRILEMGAQNPNCQPFVGEDSYGFYHQIGLEHYVQLLFQKHCKDARICPCCGSALVLSFEKMGTDYHRCTLCKSVFVPDGLPNDDMIGGGMEVERNTQQNEERVHRFVSLTSLDARFLDFGCGHGMLVNYMKGRRMDIVGYDKYNPTYEKLPKGEFDLVSMVEVIEHISQPFEELDTIHKMLKTGGQLYVETSFVDLFPEPIKDSFYINPEVGHCTMFSHHGLNLLMSKKGFREAAHINDNVRVFQKI